MQPDACLTMLPESLLLLIWHQLAQPDPADPVQEVRDQHALRSTCRALRDATAGFIKTTAILVDHAATEGPVPAWDASVSAALEQLARFPSTCTLATLTWIYWEAEGQISVFDKPALLPTFFQSARARLAAMENVTLRGHLDITQGDLYQVADSCPNLQCLTLDAAPLLGPVFTPLSRLQQLRTLCLFDLIAPHGTAWLGPSLSHLSHITELEASSDHRHTDPSLLVLEDLLPHLSGLSSLRTLTLLLSTRRVRDDNRVFQHLSALSSLTSFECLCDNDKYVGRPLRGVEVSGLALATGLVSLSLLKARLDADGVRLVAALPALTSLRAEALEPDRDLSGLGCRWRQLQVVALPYEHLIWLPLTGVERLVVDLRVSWHLDPVASTTSDADLAATLRRAAELLAPRWQSSRKRILSLLWTDGGGGGGGDVAAPAPVRCAAVLAALAPLRGAPAFEMLELWDRWPIDGALVQHLEASLPELRMLTVFSTGPGFAAFAAAVGVGFRGLKKLVILREAHVVPSAAQSALLAMAALRASSRLRLGILVGMA